MARRTSPVLLRRQLGDELRRHREAVGQKAGDVAKALGVNPSVISRLENGQRRPILLYVLALGEHYGLDRPTMDHLKGLARAAHEEGWWERYNSADTPTEYAGFEVAARSIIDYELSLVPGLLQTPDYTRVLLKALNPKITEEEIREGIGFRAKRQQALFSEDPIRFHAVINESVLHYLVGGAFEVWQEQLTHLVTCAGRPNITLQVLPFTARAELGLLGSFSVLEFADDLVPDVAHTETVLGSSFKREAPEVGHCKKIFAEISEAAAEETESLRMIKRLRESRNN